MVTPKQGLIAHLETLHQEYSNRGNHRQLALHHRHLHDGVLTHSHSPDGWATGHDQRATPITLIKPKNPSSSKAEDRNWTLQISGHPNKDMVQFVRLYATRDGDDKGAKQAAEQWLGWAVADWVPLAGGFGVNDDFTTTAAKAAATNALFEKYLPGGTSE